MMTAAGTVLPSWRVMWVIPTGSASAQRTAFRVVANGWEARGRDAVEDLRHALDAGAFEARAGASGRRSVRRGAKREG